MSEVFIDLEMRDISQQQVRRTVVEDEGEPEWRTASDQSLSASIMHTKYFSHHNQNGEYETGCTVINRMEGVVVKYHQSNGT